MSLNIPDEKILEFKSRIFKVIGDANRLKIIEILRSGENCQCEIIPLIAQSQPTVSRHLKLLEEAGLIRSTTRAGVIITSYDSILSMSWTWVISASSPSL